MHACMHARTHAIRHDTVCLSFLNLLFCFVFASNGPLFIICFDFQLRFILEHFIFNLIFASDRNAKLSAKQVVSN